MSSHLLDGLTTTDALSAVFSDESTLEAMLRVESTLAQVEARAGVIPEKAANAIGSCAKAALFDAEAIARASRESGTPTIPLVKALTDLVRHKDPAAAIYVHWGATSQDIADTALVLLLVKAFTIVGRDHERLQASLRSLSDEHAQTLMLGRTLLQPAPPITFGLKAAGWVGATGRSWVRLTDAFEEALVLQFGGATGTLAALGPKASAVARALSIELGLPNVEAPWHAHRDRLAALVAACGVYTGTLGKIARDISLLMQAEVGEASEPGGRSSSMPQKRNPAGCAITLAAATRVPGLVATFLTGMVQEHERSVGGWHAEWPTLAAVVESTGAALAAMAAAMQALAVDPERMRANIERTNGSVFAEKVIALASAALGREAAEKLVSEALERSRSSGKRFAQVLSRVPEIAGALSTEELSHLETPEAYLGMAETFRVQLLSTARPNE